MKIALAITHKINLAQKYTCANSGLSPLNYVFVSESTQADKTGFVFFFFSPSEALSATTSKNHSGLNILDSFNCQSSCLVVMKTKTTTLLWQDLCAHIKSCINTTGTELQA